MLSSVWQARPVADAEDAKGINGLAIDRKVLSWQVCHTLTPPTQASAKNIPATTAQLRWPSERHRATQLAAQQPPGSAFPVPPHSVQMHPQSKGCRYRKSTFRAEHGQAQSHLEMSFSVPAPLARAATPGITTRARVHPRAHEAPVPCMWTLSCSDGTRPALKHPRSCNCRPYPEATLNHI